MLCLDASSINHFHEGERHTFLVGSLEDIDGDALEILTFMVLVANLASTKRCKKAEKLLKPWHMGTHLRVLSESFPMNTNVTGFRCSFFLIIASLCFRK